GFLARSLDATSTIDANMPDNLMTNKTQKGGGFYFCCLIGFSVAVAITAAAAETPFVVALRGKPPQSLGPTSYRTNDLAIVSQIMEGLIKFDPMNPSAPPGPNL